MRAPLITIPTSGVFHRRTGVCLNMIVRDETPVIERLLRSVRSAVDYFVIVDTGSTDGTPELVHRLAQEFDLPGEVHFRDWVNFGHNRQQALELALAANRADWLLFIDADEELVCANPDFFLRLEPGITYLLDCCSNEDRGALPNLVDVRHSQWEWRSPIHEYLKFLGGTKHWVHSTEAWILYHEGEGSRSRGLSKREKYLRDAVLLEAVLREEPENRRNRFYLAQSYRNAGEHWQAYKNYERRTRMGGRRDEETYGAQYEKAKLAIVLGLGHEVIINEIAKAYEMRPTRAEPLWLLARYCRSLGFYSDGYLCARMGIEIPYPKDILCINKAVYDWRLLEEYAYCALAIGQHREAILALTRILEDKLHPLEEQERIKTLLATAKRADANHQMLSDKLYPIHNQIRSAPSLVKNESPPKSRFSEAEPRQRD